MRRALPIGLVVTGVLAFGASGCESDIGPEPSSSLDGRSVSTPAPKNTPAPSSTSYRLTNGGKTLVASDGTQTQVNPKLVVGYLDSATPNGDFVDVSGWAAPADLSQPADVVVAIAGGKSVAVITPSGDRPDLVEGYDRPGLAKAGFAMSIPTKSLDCSAPDQGLKTFAIAGQAAGPLEWLADVPKLIAESC